MSTLRTAGEFVGTECLAQIGVLAVGWPWLLSVSWIAHPMTCLCPPIISAQYLRVYSS